MIERDVMIERVASNSVCTASTTRLVSMLCRVTLWPALLILHLTQSSALPAQTVCIESCEDRLMLLADTHGGETGFFPEFLGAITALEDWTIEYVSDRREERLVRLSAVPIDVVTSCETAEDRRTAIAAECTRFAEEPSNPETFIDQIVPDSSGGAQAQ